MAVETTTIHASAVLLGRKAALIRGPAGSGKSQLVWELLQAAAQGALSFARLVGDDRVHLQAHSDRLLVRSAPALAGMLEIRGLGIRRLTYEPLAVVGLVVDLAAEDAVRHPSSEARQVAIDGVCLPRLAVAARTPAQSMVLAVLKGPTAGI